MAIAREIQESLLPTQETRAHSFVVAGAQHAAAEVGGDYYDIFPVPDGRIGVVIADVSGKGLAGCLVTSMLAVLIRAFRSTELDPSRMLVRLQEGLWESIRRNTFVTMFYGLIDPRSGRLTCASAGHSPALIYRAARGEIEWLRSPGIPIGAIGGNVLEETLANSIVDLEPGDVLVQYTDGINEAFDPRRQQFGFGRLEQVVSGAAPRGCRHLLDTVQEVIRDWRHADVPTDDETLLVISRELGDSDESPAQLPVESSRAFALESSVAGRDASTAELAVEQIGDPAAQETALEFLGRAQAGGCRLEIDARFDALPGVRNWLVECPGYDRLSASQAILVELALWEVCANIIEHGYHEDQGQSFQLWAMTEPPIDEIGEGGPFEAMSFVVLDHGVSFRPRGRLPVDLTDPSVRRRGRGLGLELIHAVMRRVRYQPGTPEGNITILEFDPTARLENISNVG
jgi:anti-sigma regulatory factor (Ser/Thr protein kinase)